MKTAFHYLLFLSDAVNAGTKVFVASLLVALSILLISGVFFRYVLNHSLYWSGEVSRFLLVYLTFFGSTVAYKAGAHIGIEIIMEKLHPNLEKALKVIIHATFMGFWIMILAESLKLLPLFYMQKTATLEIPYAYPFMCVPIASGIWILHTLSETIKATLGE